MRVKDEVRHPATRSMLRDFLRDFGLQPTDTNVEHLAVLLEAVEVHDERARKYADQWQRAGAFDNLRNARRKVNRQMGTLSTLSETDRVALAEGNDDDAIDAINYCAFAVRNMRLLNIDEVEDDEEDR